MDASEQSISDRDLLGAYQKSRSAEVFGQLVRRHVNFVYGVALRHVKTPQTAEDIAQEVFMTLLRKALRLDLQKPLVAWLFKTTRLIALHSLRSASRRRRHEREVAMPQNASITPDPTWSLIADDVDNAVAGLQPSERDVILLRYFAGNSNQEIAADLTISEEAAKKRVQRAVESLRQLLTARGLVIPAAGLTAALGHASAQAAPPALAATIAHATLSATAGPTIASILQGVLMATVKTKVAIIAAAAALILIPTALVIIHPGTREPPRPPPATVAAEPVAAEPVVALPEADDPLTEFVRLYKLGPDEDIVRIAPPFIAARDVGFELMNQGRMRGQDAFGNTTPSAMFISWNDGARNIRSATWGGRRTVSTLLQDCLQVSPESVEGDAQVLQRLIPGDFIIRAGATQEQKRIAMQKVFSQALEGRFSLTFREVERPVYVLRGTWNYRKIDFVETRSPPHAGEPAPLIEIYGGETFDPSAPQEDNGVTFGAEGLAYVIERWIKSATVVEAQGVPNAILWRCNGTSSISPLALLAAHNPKSVLDHVTEQTGLTWTTESRAMRRLFVELVKP